MSDDERLMQLYLKEEYAKRNLSMLDEIKKWREQNPKASYGEAIRVLYEQLEKD